MSDFIWDSEANQIGWIAGDDVFSVATKQKVATRQGLQLFSLDDKPLNYHLQNANGGNVEGQAAIPEDFLKLLKG